MASSEPKLAEEALVPSAGCRLDQMWLSEMELATSASPRESDVEHVHRWSTAWRNNGGEVICSVRELESLVLEQWRPVRRFAWRTRQRHRPGLQYLVSTGRHHGFESLAEQRVLLALDFAGRLQEVFSQPFLLRFQVDGCWRTHVPDLLAVSAASTLLIDVRPGGRGSDDDRTAFAATTDVARVTGWGYAVVTGWRRHVFENLDALSAQRRPLSDPLGIQEQLLTLVADRPRSFGQIVAASPSPPIARAQALHLLWNRRLAVDLGRRLCDASTVWPAVGGGG